MTERTPKHAGSMKKIQKEYTKIFHIVIKYLSQMVASHFPNIPVVR